MKVHASDTDIPFIVTVFKGNPAVVVFSMQEDDGISSPHVEFASIIPARDSRLDLLFLGGDMFTDGYSCFEREEATKATGNQKK